MSHKPPGGHQPIPARVTSATPWGVDARAVTVIAEVDVSNDTSGIQIVGLPDAAVRESRERVRLAITACGFKLPPRVMTAKLEPVDLGKSAAHLDLALAVAFLAALGHLDSELLDGCMLVGELGLDGSVRPIRAALAAAELAEGLGMRELLIPAQNAGEAAALGGALPVVPVRSLGEAVAHLTGKTPIPSASTTAPFFPDYEADPPCFSEIRGREAAKRALEVAAAGGHNVILVGPPGVGKMMLARRLPGILPPMSEAEAVAVTKIHSLVATEPPQRLISERPFRSPYPKVRAVGMVGGGSFLHPGEASLAHAGVLFLDELPEFRRDALESLRWPLETGEVTVLLTADGQIRLPARFVLIAAMPACPCGHLGDPRLECDCAPAGVERYWSRLEGPLLDRIDMFVEVGPAADRELRGRPGERSGEIAARVVEARKVARRRFNDETAVNAAMSPEQMREHCQLNPETRALLDHAVDRWHLPAGAVRRILVVGRTIADLDGAETLRACHVAEALQHTRMPSVLSRTEEYLTARSAPWYRWCNVAERPRDP